jgi:hypothetical protein
MSKLQEGHLALIKENPALSGLQNRPTLINLTNLINLTKSGGIRKTDPTLKKFRIWIQNTVLLLPLTLISILVLAKPSLCASTLSLYSPGLLISVSNSVIISLLLCPPLPYFSFLSGPEAKFLDEIQTKFLRVFLLAIHSHLYSFALGFLLLQTHATSYSFFSSLLYTVKKKEGKP